MHIIKCHPYRELERITRLDGVRHYVCPNTGKHLPSVTTILSATADQTKLLEWRERVGDKKADQERDDACALGTLMHTHLENHVLDVPRPKGSNLIRVMSKNMSDKIIETGLVNVDEVWGLEVALYTPDLFAGTTDVVGLYKGRTAIMDYKTTKKMKTRTNITDYFCQLAAYCISHDVIYGTNIETGVIFMVARDLEYKTFEITGAELQHYKEMFLQRVDKYISDRLP